MADLWEYCRPRKLQAISQRAILRQEELSKFSGFAVGSARRSFWRMLVLELRLRMTTRAKASEYRKHGRRANGLHHESKDEQTLQSLVMFVSLRTIVRQQLPVLSTSGSQGFKELVAALTKRLQQCRTGRCCPLSTLPRSFACSTQRDLRKISIPRVSPQITATTVQPSAFLSFRRIFSYSLSPHHHLATFENSPASGRLCTSHSRP